MVGIAKPIDHIHRKSLYGGNGLMQVNNSLVDVHSCGKFFTNPSYILREKRWLDAVKLISRRLHLFAVHQVLCFKFAFRYFRFVYATTWMAVWIMTTTQIQYSHFVVKRKVWHHQNVIFAFSATYWRWSVNNVSWENTNYLRSALICAVTALCDCTVWSVGAWKQRWTYIDLGSNIACNSLDTSNHVINVKRTTHNQFRTSLPLTWRVLVLRDVTRLQMQAGQESSKSCCMDTAAAVGELTSDVITERLTQWWRRWRQRGSYGW